MTLGESASLKIIEWKRNVDMFSWVCGGSKWYL